MAFSRLILEWVAVPFSTGSSQSRIEPRCPALQADSFPAEPPGKPKNTGMGSLSLFQMTFLTQELNWGLLHCRQMSFYQLSYQGSPNYYEFKNLKNEYINIFIVKRFTYFQICVKKFISRLDCSPQCCN